MSTMRNGERKNRADWQSQLNFFHARLKNQREDIYLKQKLKILEKSFGSKVSDIQQESRQVKLDSIGLTKTSGCSSEGWFEVDDETMMAAKDGTKAESDAARIDHETVTLELLNDGKARLPPTTAMYDSNYSKGECRKGKSIIGIGGKYVTRGADDNEENNSFMKRLNRQTCDGKFARSKVKRHKVQDRGSSKITITTGKMESIKKRPISVELGYMRQGEGSNEKRENEGHLNTGRDGSKDPRPWSAGDALGTDRPATSKRLKELMKDIRKRHNRERGCVRTGNKEYEGAQSKRNSAGAISSHGKVNRIVDPSIRSKWIQSALKVNIAGKHGNEAKKVKIIENQEGFYETKERTLNSKQYGMFDKSSVTERGGYESKTTGYGLFALLLKAQAEQNQSSVANKIPDVRQRRMSKVEENLKHRRDNVLQSSIASLISETPLKKIDEPVHERGTFGDSQVPQTIPESVEPSTSNEGIKTFNSIAQNGVANNYFENNNYTLGSRLTLKSVVENTAQNRISLKKNVEVNDDDSDNERPISARVNNGIVQEGLVSKKTSAKTKTSHPTLENDLVQLKRTLAALQTTRERELRAMQEEGVVDPKKEIDQKRREKLMSKVKGFNSVLDETIKERKRDHEKVVLIDLTI